MTPTSGAGAKCPICGAPAQTLGELHGTYFKTDFRFRRCPVCQFTFVENPCVDYARIYDENYYRGLGADPTLDYLNELEHPETSVRVYEWRGVLKVVNALHPGLILTEVTRHLPKAILQFLGLLNFFLKNPLEGAQTTIYLAASQSPEVLESGRYFIDCHSEPTAPQALDDATAKKLWEVSERITKLA